MNPTMALHPARQLKQGLESEQLRAGKKIRRRLRRFSRFTPRMHERATFLKKRRTGKVRGQKKVEKLEGQITQMKTWLAKRGTTAALKAEDVIVDSFIGSGLKFKKTSFK